MHADWLCRLAECAGVQAPTPKYYAEVRPVTRVEQIGNCLAVPASVAPTPDLHR